MCLGGVLEARAVASHRLFFSFLLVLPAPERGGIGSAPAPRLNGGRGGKRRAGTRGRCLCCEASKGLVVSLWTDRSSINLLLFKESGAGGKKNKLGVF